MKRSYFAGIMFLIVGSVYAQNPDFRIATFNIQNFGQSKLAKNNITDTLASIVRAFDIVAVQEMSDISNRTPRTFLDKVNHDGARYALACSPRTGRQPDDKSSAEQYAFYFNTNTVQLLDTALFDDAAHDYFQREPWIAKFRRKSDGLTFSLCTIHTMPQRAVDEIDALIHVADWIPARFDVRKAMIFCGDFNASCSYAADETLQALAIRKPPYYWIVPDNAKTNLSKKDCAYDRFVVTEVLKNRISNWQVYRAFKTKAVSDHWPVYITLK